MLSYIQRFSLIALVALASHFARTATLFAAETLTLKTVVEAALHHSPVLEEIAGRHAAAKAEYLAALAPYDWTVAAEARYSDNEQPREVVFQPSRITTAEGQLGLRKRFRTGTLVAVEGASIRTEDNSTFNLLNKRYQPTLSLQAEQDLLENAVGRFESAAVEAARIRFIAAEADIWRSIEEAAADAARAYWNVWRQQKSLRVAEESEANNRQLHEATTRLANRGLRDESEILQTKAAWLSAKDQRINQNNQLHTAWVQLRADFGLTRWDPENIPPLEPPEIPTSFSPSAVDARETRGDIAAARRRLEAARAMADATGSLKLPELSLVGGYRLTGLARNFSDSVDQISGGAYPSWNVGLVFSHAFGQRGDRADIARAHAETLTASSFLTRSLNRLDADLETTAADTKRALERLAIASEIDDARTRIFSLFSEKYRQGRISMQDLLQAEDAASQARFNRQNAAARVAFALVEARLTEGSYLSELGYDQTPLLKRFIGENP